MQVLIRFGEAKRPSKLLIANAMRLMRCGLVYTARAVEQRVAGVGGLLALLAY